ncbi:GDP-mannose 4,6-dehydratase [Frigoriglobus tundricola]|uniref:GDP-mannose 4,6-dehydratase n=1 Tax=Frigoriglobus tundricola TaxID=2774151 RepID=A0A6M5Z4S3_9BACT|nr:GDP-mannose 4,6-dehydratase [Frigoriglobus tundricola]QJX00481.1 hypothetical protein FTUN_8111 [Frigoriglobus tundricola]
MSSRRAIVIGAGGQDGRLLTRLLLGRGYGVLAVSRSSVKAFGLAGSPNECNVSRPESVRHTVERLQPDEVYYLAAHHASAEQAPRGVSEDYAAGWEVNVAGVLHVLEAVRRHSPAARFFFASSSLVFGQSPTHAPQDESTPAAPDEPYGLWKLLATHACRDYRKRYGTYASVGILYNHESVYRRPEFLSAKLVRAAVAAAKGVTDPVTVGDLDAAVDWGYAPDFVEAFTRILSLDCAGDFVVATGQAHTVREFASAAFGSLGLDWRVHVVEDPRILIRRPGKGRVGNPAKLRRLTGWEPTLSFNDMVAALVGGAVQSERHAVLPRIDNA